MKEMSFRVATMPQPVAIAHLSDCTLSDDNCCITFASDEIAAAVYDQLENNEYCMFNLWLVDNTIVTNNYLIDFKKSEEYSSCVDIIWKEESFHHIQCAEGVGCWLRKPRTRNRINLEKN